MIVCVAVVLEFLAYLVFLGFVIVRTGSTEGLPDVASAIKAFGSSRARWSAMGNSRSGVDVKVRQALSEEGRLPTL